MNKIIYLGSNHDNSGNIWINDKPMDDFDNHEEIELIEKYTLISFNDESILGESGGSTLEELYKNYYIDSEYEDNNPDEEFTFEDFIKWIKNSSVDCDSAYAMFIIDSDTEEMVEYGDCILINYNDYLEDQETIPEYTVDMLFWAAIILRESLISEYIEFENIDGKTVGKSRYNKKYIMNQLNTMFYDTARYIELNRKHIDLSPQTYITSYLIADMKSIDEGTFEFPVLSKLKYRDVSLIDFITRKEGLTEEEDWELSKPIYWRQQFNDIKEYIDKQINSENKEISDAKYQNQ